MNAVPNYVHPNPRREVPNRATQKGPNHVATPRKRREVQEVAGVAFPGYAEDSVA